MENYLKSTQYLKDFRKATIKCKNYLNACYSKKVQKNRRILHDMYRIFGIIDEKTIKKDEDWMKIFNWYHLLEFPHPNTKDKVNY